MKTTKKTPKKVVKKRTKKSPRKVEEFSFFTRVVNGAKRIFSPKY